MKVQYTITKSINADAKYLKIVIPADFLEEWDVHATLKSIHTLSDAVKKFGMLRADGGENLLLIIDIDAGRVVNWPTGKLAVDFYNMKVVDECMYMLLDEDMKPIPGLSYEGYVPDCVGEGGWGDYFEFEVEDDGTIPNWNFDQEMFDNFKTKCDIE